MVKCYAPYIGVFYRTNNNRISPCCQYRTTTDPDEYNYQTAVDDIEGQEQTPNCNTCWEREKYGKSTLRHSFDRYKEAFAPDHDGKVLHQYMLTYVQATIVIYSVICVRHLTVVK